MRNLFSKAASLLRSGFGGAARPDENPYAPPASQEIDYAKHPATRHIYFTILAIGLDLHPDKVTPLSMWLYKRTTPRAKVEAAIARAREVAKEHFEALEEPSPDIR